MMTDEFTECLLFSLQSIVGVAGGATRAALTVHQARRNNMADISAKDGSQVGPRGCVSASDANDGIFSDGIVSLEMAGALSENDS